MDEYIHLLEQTLMNLVSMPQFWVEVVNNTLFVCRWCKGWGETILGIEHQHDCPICDALELRDQLVKEGNDANVKHFNQRG